MRRLAAGLLTAGLLALPTPVLPVSTPVAAAAPAPVQAPQEWARLTIGGMTPQIVDADSTSVRITGTVTNTSDRPITDVRAQLRIGQAARDDTDVSHALGGLAAADRGTQFVPVTGALAPGQSAPVDITVAVAGSGGLGIGQPGVYPLLVNINGQPAYGGQTRLATAGMLLPVRATATAAAPGAPADPARLTLLWPLVDTQPRYLGTTAGTTASGVPLLADDDLARSLAPGGRLYGLVNAAQQAADAGDTELSAMCFAVDPDLLATVVAMTHGYQVRTATGTVAGKGQAAATAWLGDLRGLLSGRCVLALPYADADLTALARSGATDLTRLAIGSAAQVTSALAPAAVQPLTDVVWPAGGSLDQRTMTQLAGLGDATALLSPDALQPAQPAGGGPRQISGIVGGARAITTDDLTSDGLSGRVPTQESRPGPGPSSATPATEPAIAVQNGLGALVYRTEFATTPGRQVLITPPRRWNAPQAQLAAFLRTVQQAIDGHYATPVALGTVLGTQPTGAAATLNYLPQAAAAEVPGTITAAVLTQDARQNDVQSAMKSDPTSPAVKPSGLIQPLRYGLLRAVSDAWRDGRGAGAQNALAAVSGALDSYTAQVEPVSPPQAISWASKDSQLPLTVRNGLPVDVTVRVNLSTDAGLRPAAVDSAVVPAEQSLTVFVPAKVNRSGRFSVQATLSTPGGTALGQPARLELVSSTYGTIILVVTGIAFGALVLLSARRIYRRIRAARRAGPAPAA